MGKSNINDPRAVQKVISARTLEVAELKQLLSTAITALDAKKEPEAGPLEVEVINESGNLLPGYSLPGSAGVDLRAFLKRGITIKPGETKCISTGLKMNIPFGYELQIRSRSGLALQVQVIMLNAPGTIDAGYQGDIGLIVHNGGKEGFKIKNGDRIAQGVFAKHETVIFKPVEVFTDSTERGSDGFGSTNVE